MNEFTVITENHKLIVIAEGWQIAIGGYYVFFDAEGKTVAVAPPTAIVGSRNNIK